MKQVRSRLHGILGIAILLGGWFFLGSASPMNEEKRILVFTKTVGFTHNSIPEGVDLLQKVSREIGFGIDTTKEASAFTEKNLKKYDAVVFLNTTGDVLNEAQQNAFEHYIRSGGGFVGVHAAADTEFEWPWYGKLVGGYFDGHPAIQEARILVKNRSHRSTAHLPETWVRTDEWYNYKSLNPEIEVLATLDEQSYKGGTNGTFHPFIWYHEYDGGRAFYTGAGHTRESYSEPAFVKHLTEGLLWAMGE